MHHMSNDKVCFLLSFGRPAAAVPIDDPDGGVPVELRERIRDHILLLQASVRKELCERGYVVQDQPDSELLYLLLTDVDLV
jgi:hypothetical protein